MAFAYKWHDEKRIYVRGLCDMKGYTRGGRKEKALLKEVWALLNAADIVIAHNGDRFDILVANMGFLRHGFQPPTPFDTIDTLKIARNRFKFPSNKLDDLARELNIGRKLAHTGKKLWIDCMAGDLKAWKLMKRYNAHDVYLLEQVYLKLRPWGRHPNLNVIARANNCPACLSKRKKNNGTHTGPTSWAQKYRCLDCGKCYRGAHVRYEKNERVWMK